jgi:hypothetical protein
MQRMIAQIGVAVNVESMVGYEEAGQLTCVEFFHTTNRRFTDQGSRIESYDCAPLLPTCV